MKIKQLLGLILLWCIDECSGQGITIVNNCTCKTFDGGIYSLMPLRRTDGKPRYTRLSVQSTVHKIIFAINWVDNVYFGHRKEFLKLTPRALAPRHSLWGQKLQFSQFCPCIWETTHIYWVYWHFERITWLRRFLSMFLKQVFDCWQEISWLAIHVQSLYACRCGRTWSWCRSSQNMSRCCCEFILWLLTDFFLKLKRFRYCCYHNCFCLLFSVTDKNLLF